MKGLRLQGFTREKCRPKDWNTAKQEFRRSLPGAEDAINVLKAVTERLQKCYRDLRTAGIAPTVALLRNAVNPAAAVPDNAVCAVMAAT